MAYRRFHRGTRRVESRTITVKYAGHCAGCGAPIAAGETAEYEPIGYLGSTVARLRHVANSWDEGERVSMRCFHNLRPALKP